MADKKYDMNLLSVTAMGIGSVVGAGIFALLGQVARMAGDKIYCSFVIAGIAAMFSGYSYAKLAGKYPESGGLTDYFRLAYRSKTVSGLLSVVYLLTSAVSVSMMAKSFGIYAVNFFEEIPDTAFWINLFAAALIISSSVLNMMGASDVGRTEILLVAVKIVILFVLTGFAFYDYVPSAAAPAPSPSTSAFLGSIGITFFAYAGYGIMTNAAAEVKNPGITIYAAIFLALSIVLALYLGLAFVILNYIPAAELKDNADIAVAVVARRLMGEWGYLLIYLTAVIAYVSGINATYFSIFRITRSLATQRIFPSFYIRPFWRYGTWGNAFTTTLVLLATVFFDFNSIVNFASAAYLISYLAVFVANWKLRRETDSSPLLILIGILLMQFILIGFLASLV